MSHSTFHWRQDAFAALREVAGEARTHNYQLYGDYCEKRERGDRRGSLNTIREFIDDAKTWSIDSR